MQLEVAHFVYIGFSMALLYTLILLGGMADLVRSADLAEYVLTTTGSEGGGNTFPGVSEPFGMVKLGPDLYTGTDSYAGYQPSGVFKGFSMLHLSGTGGAPKYGVVAQMPVLGAVENPLADQSTGRRSPDVSEVGYYRSSLSSNITVELAAASRAGMYRYTFPSPAPATGPQNVIVDVSHLLPSFRGMKLEQHYLGGGIKVDRNDAGVMRYQGSGSYNNGWNRAPKWTVHFCGTFDTPGNFRTFLATDDKSSTLARYSTDGEVESLARLGAVFSFRDATSVSSRVGVSFISRDKACRNLDGQVPAGTTLPQLRDRTRQVWNSRVLSKVTTTETNTTKLQHLYTSMYFMHLMPTDKTGENPMWDSAEPYYDDIFTLWDLFRCTTSLLHVLQPEVYEGLIRSMIDTWRHDGYMPDGRSSFFNGATQGGSNSDTVLADAYIKGVRGAVDWEDGFAAMVKNAEVAPPNNEDPRDRSSSTKEGRGALPDWIRLGYISTRYGRSVSRAVEYAGNDFGLFQVAKGLGRVAEADKYLKRSRQWRNHWNPEITSHGFSGFLGPREETGRFREQDAISCNGCYWGDHYYQALPWEYSFNAHHDIDTLKALSGGDAAFVRRLEMTFQPNVRDKGHERFNKMIFDPGNEPSFATPFLFSFAGRQDLAVKTSRMIGKTYYSPKPRGIPGNSDGGAMESWILWVMLGLYPMTGQTTFLVGSPWFSDLTVSLGGGRWLRITAANASESSFYVQSLRVNGRDWNKGWVTWDDVFARGGTMEYVLGPEPADWTSGSPPPPSPASESNVGESYTGASSGPGGKYSGPGGGGAGAGAAGAAGGGGGGGGGPDGGGAALAPYVLPVALTLSCLVAAGLAVLGALLYIRRRRRRRLAGAAAAATAESGAAAGGGTAIAAVVKEGSADEPMIMVAGRGSAGSSRPSSPPSSSDDSFKG